MGRGRVLHMTWYLQCFTSFKTFKVAEEKKYFDDSIFSFLTEWLLDRHRCTIIIN